MSEQAKFLTGSLFKHVSVMSLTASVGLIPRVLVIDVFWPNLWSRLT